MFTHSAGNGESVAPPGAAGFATPPRDWRTVTFWLLCTCLTSVARAQAADPATPVTYPHMDDVTTPPPPFKSDADSLSWERARLAATRAGGFRVVVSLRERQVMVMRGADTLRNATAAVASGLTIEMDGQSWTFRTPRGRHTVLRKLENPVWRPPDWLYAETALSHHLALVRLQPDRPVRVNDDELPGDQEPACWPAQPRDAFVFAAADRRTHRVQRHVVHPAVRHAEPPGGR